MLKIQVLGSGMIPRGFGIAPRKEPFNADLDLITIILQTPGLKMNYLDKNGQFKPLDRTNVRNVWREYVIERKSVQGKPVVQAQTAPADPAKGAEPPKPAEPPKAVTPPAPPAPPAAPAQTNPPAKPATSAPTPAQNNQNNNGQPKQEEKKEEKKPEEKKDQTPAPQTNGGIKPVHNDDKK